MSLKRKKKAGRRPKPEASSKHRGFDFGLIPFAAALSSVGFPEKLTNAEIVAVAYGESLSESLGRSVPTITLVGRHPEQLIAAFLEFNAWVEASDGDALDIIFVFRKAGGYLLGLSPEKRRLEKRCMGYARVLHIVTFFASWIKQLDSVNPHLLRIRDYCKRFPAPVLVGAAHLPAAHSISAAQHKMVVPIDGITPILKFEMQFVDEENATPGSVAWMVIEAARPSGKRSNPTRKPGTHLPAEVSDFRTSSMRTHFPVTLERALECQPLRESARVLVGLGWRRWQVDQAICNSVLSQELTKRPHYEGLSARTLTGAIVSALEARYEMANMSGLPEITTEQLEQQALADANVLARSFGISRRLASVAQSQAALKRLGLLDLGDTAYDNYTIRAL
jgi:hypothetical protein